MKNIILLANIGNRNIRYDGHTFFELPLQLKENHDFRSLTKLWDENFPQERDKLKLNIIDKLLDKYQADIEQVVLFSSNQISERRQDQDTLYEGAIMQKLIQNNYSISVKVDQVQCAVVDNDALIRFYRDKLRNYRQRYPNHTFLICDAGGTPQQKAALKIMAEYLLGGSKYKVYYVTPPPDDNLYEAPQKEYRRVIDDEQARSLIRSGQYRAALLLRGFARPQDALLSSSQADLLLLFAYARFNRLDDLMSEVASSFGKRIVDYPEILSASQQQSILSNRRFEEVVGDTAFFILGEWLAKTRMLHRNRRYNEAILSLAVFYEMYLAAVIHYKLGYNIVDDDRRYNEWNRLISNARRLFPNVSSAYPDTEQRLPTDVPFQLLVCRNIESPINSAFLDMLEPHISSGKNRPNTTVALNTIRNKIAHNGRFVTDEDWSAGLRYADSLLNDLYSLFGLPNEDPYEAINRRIEILF